MIREIELYIFSGFRYVFALYCLLPVRQMNITRKSLSIQSIQAPLSSNRPAVFFHENIEALTRCDVKSGLGEMLVAFKKISYPLIRVQKAGRLQDLQLRPQLIGNI